MNKPREKLYRLRERVLSFLYPPTCPLCHEVTEQGRMGVLCRDCVSVYERELVTICPMCGYYPEGCECVPEFTKDGHGTLRRLTFFGFYTGYREESSVARLIYSMKRVADSSVHMFMARQMAQSISRVLAFDKELSGEIVVTYIPRSKNSLRKYGFDQMKLISSEVARFLGGRVQNVFVRARGAEQKALGAIERRKNADDTIFLRKNVSLRGKRIIILDDVVTTGSSMRRAAELILSLNPSEIIPAAAFLSRTVKILPEDEK